ncbi:HU family DNA-binding protein [Skermanella stibiiresistens]|nr:HU family DNA-binding protein [Skermanella stibiiresistens]
MQPRPQIGSGIGRFGVFALSPGRVDGRERVPPMVAACSRGLRMNQAELIAAVAERAGLTKADAGKAVEALVGTITDTLKRGDEIRIAGFGTFGVSERGERQGRNPQTGAEITIAASKAARFTAGKAVKDALNGG